jgi:CRP-like cAMP-binding protein
LAGEQLANGRNHILAALTPADASRVAERLKAVELKQHAILYEPQQRLSHMYFVESGMISLVSSTGKGAEVETGIVGPEGASGIALFHGVPLSYDRGVVQVAGEGHMLAADQLAELVDTCPSLRAGLHRFSYGLTALTAYASACNRRHTIDRRLARWLLLVQDRVQKPVLPLTHQFMAQMLGVRRSSVTIFADELRAAGLIQYTRGNVTVIDRPGLERAACDCYRAMQVAFAAAGLPNTAAS